MRKTVVITLAAIVFFALHISGCKSKTLAPKNMHTDLDCTLESSDSNKGVRYMYEKMAELRKDHADKLLFDTFECLAWEDQESYAVVISSDTQTVNGCLIFSKSGQLLNETGFSAITINNVSELLAMTEEDLTAKFGSFHFDSGSGRYLPAYVTNSGSILVFSLENGFVDSIYESRIIDGKTYSYGKAGLIVVEQ